ncbi:hypothetical protein NL393_39965, partial [Klebsiella pneumoniae]|nr:hypothetical protein [Klebsiella pneumoniae]
MVLQVGRSRGTAGHDSILKAGGGQLPILAMGDDGAVCACASYNRFFVTQNHVNIALLWRVVSME